MPKKALSVLERHRQIQAKYEEQARQVCTRAYNPAEAFLKKRPYSQRQSLTSTSDHDGLHRPLTSTSEHVHDRCLVGQRRSCSTASVSARNSLLNISTADSGDLAKEDERHPCSREFALSAGLDSEDELPNLTSENQANSLSTEERLGRAGPTFGTGGATPEDELWEGPAEKLLRLSPPTQTDESDANPLSQSEVMMRQECNTTLSTTESGISNEARCHTLRRNDEATSTAVTEAPMRLPWREPFSAAGGERSEKNGLPTSQNSRDTSPLRRHKRADDLNVAPAGIKKVSEVVLTHEPILRRSTRGQENYDTFWKGVVICFWGYTKTASKHTAQACRSYEQLPANWLRKFNTQALHMGATVIVGSDDQVFDLLLKLCNEPTRPSTCIHICRPYGGKYRLQQSWQKWRRRRADPTRSARDLVNETSVRPPTDRWRLCDSLLDPDKKSVLPSPSPTHRIGTPMWLHFCVYDRHHYPEDSFIFFHPDYESSVYTPALLKAKHAIAVFPGLTSSVRILLLGTEPSRVSLRTAWDFTLWSTSIEVMLGGSVVPLNEVCDTEPDAVVCFTSPDSIATLIESSELKVRSRLQNLLEKNTPFLRFIWLTDTYQKGAVQPVQQFLLNDVLRELIAFNMPPAPVDPSNELALFFEAPAEVTGITTPDWVTPVSSPGGIAKQIMLTVPASIFLQYPQFPKAACTMLPSVAFVRIVNPLWVALATFCDVVVQMTALPIEIVSQNINIALLHASEKTLPFSTRSLSSIGDTTNHRKEKDPRRYLFAPIVIDAHGLRALAPQCVSSVRNVLIYDLPEIESDVGDSCSALVKWVDDNFTPWGQRLLAHVKIEDTLKMLKRSSGPVPLKSQYDKAVSVTRMRECRQFTHVDAIMNEAGTDRVFTNRTETAIELLHLSTIRKLRQEVRECARKRLSSLPHWQRRMCEQILAQERGETTCLPGIRTVEGHQLCSQVALGHLEFELNVQDFGHHTRSGRTLSDWLEKCGYLHQQMLDRALIYYKNELTS